MLEALRQVWTATSDKRFSTYIQREIDLYVKEDGTIRTYEYRTFNLDNIPTGRQLLWLYSKTGQDKYRRAAALLRKQLGEQPRTASGGFWHKLIYPYQMWLDGLYMTGQLKGMPEERLPGFRWLFSWKTGDSGHRYPR